MKNLNSLFVAVNIFINASALFGQIVKTFPTEEQLEKESIALYSGSSFDIYLNQIFYCDQSECKIYVFNHEGNYKYSFGRAGQGPGEFNKPYKIIVYKDEIYVSDNGNGRIQVFTLEGNYKRQIKLATTVFDMAIISDKLFIGNPLTILRYKDKSDITLFEIYDLMGVLERKIRDPFPDTYAMPIYSQTFTMNKISGEVHLLQDRGQKYRIYDSEGNKNSEFDLEYDLSKDTEYKKIKYIFRYQCFTVFENTIYAAGSWKGKIVIYLFNMSGKYLRKLEYGTKEPDDIYTVASMKILQKEETLLYLLLTDPEHKFVVIKL
ncbi:MAG: 6-bladed beta-propeller [Desulfobacteraceae bacterium]|nr:MAG: 6-bladed beta-propeller [Desulfobacteraceae bacterium]